MENLAHSASLAAWCSTVSPHRGIKHLRSFANGLVKDKMFAAAAPWSNGQTERQITSLKLVKRQMFGRAKLDLLEAWLIGAP